MEWKKKRKSRGGGGDGETTTSHDWVVEGEKQRIPIRGKYISYKHKNIVNKKKKYKTIIKEANNNIIHVKADTRTEC